MKRAEKIALLVVCVLCPARQKQLRWKQQKGNQEKKIYTGKKNMQLQRKGFIYGKDDLLIPNPVTEPEAYAKAKGGRVTIK